MAMLMQNGWVTWLDKNGWDKEAKPLAMFTDGGKCFAVVDRDCGPYDFDPPYQVITLDKSELFESEPAQGS